MMLIDFLQFNLWMAILTIIMFCLSPWYKEFIDKGNSMIEDYPFHPSTFWPVVHVLGFIKIAIFWPVVLFVSINEIVQDVD